MTQANTKLNKDYLSLYEEFRKTALEKGEEQAKKYLIAHLDEFPEHIKEEIIFQLFSMNLRETNENNKALFEVEESIKDAAVAVKKLNKTLEDDEKIENLKKKLESKKKKPHE